MLDQEAIHRFGVVGVKVQADGTVDVRRALEHRTGQARVERGEEPHRLDRRQAPGRERVRLGFAPEQALVLGKGVDDFRVLRPCGAVADPQPACRLAQDPRAVLVA
ncbi:hypothetical protein [Alkalisalibacterium limincola]|uniref:Uncharacterized protein n=1 Tax=Alkalisalibacterium limincola TaxID=2699169 RepID=A0A5C8KQV4_9GAMM|nr:hypothetical protein [Alkalisalibacterium limincola]TXK62519.1 hypothetical protein FU658_07030 [Alkalisalibacterium limincola]